VTIVKLAATVVAVFVLNGAIASAQTLEKKAARSTRS
jgi:hypothetical protein